MHYFRASLLSCLLVNIINIVIFLMKNKGRHCSPHSQLKPTRPDSDAAFHQAGNGAHVFVATA